MQYDLFSTTFKANPFPTYARMRANDPVYAHRDRSGRVNWYVTRYDDVVAILHDNRFVKDVRRTQDKPSRGGRSLVAAINQNMLFSDPPDHTRLRSLVNQAFTPRRVKNSAEQITQIADELINKVYTNGQMDLIDHFALPLPVIVICDLLGIPAEARDQVAAWSQSIISPGGRGLKPRERRRMMTQFVEYLRTLFVERQQNPQDDLITALVQAEEAGERLSDMELSSMVALLLVTGHETTVNLIGNGFHALLAHPDQLALLRDQPTLIDRAVEELLRFDGPVETSTTRWVGEDLVYQEQTRDHSHAMQRGDVMRVVITSANRDERRFENADTLDITHRPRQHLQFGRGIHYCLGAPLARLEGQIALNTLVQRLENVRFGVEAKELRWRSGVLFRGLEALPLSWDCTPRINSPAT